MEIKEEYDGFIGIYDNAFDQGYIKELIKFFEASKDLPLVQESNEMRHSVDQDSLKNMDDQIISLSDSYKEPKPFKYKKRKVEISGPPPPPKKLQRDAIDISFILNFESSVAPGI